MAKWLVVFLLAIAAGIAAADSPSLAKQLAYLDDDVAIMNDRVAALDGLPLTTDLERMSAASMVMQLNREWATLRSHLLKTRTPVMALLGFVRQKIRVEQMIAALRGSTADHAARIEELERASATLDPKIEEERKKLALPANTIDRLETILERERSILGKLSAMRFKVDNAQREADRQKLLVEKTK